MVKTTLIHANCISISGCGVLLSGPPGSGKSDLTLRLIDEPGRGTGTNVMSTNLIADDQVLLCIKKGCLVAKAPPALAGLMEVRGLGIVPVPYLEEVQVFLSVHLVEGDLPERMPDFETDHVSFLGIDVPRISIDPKLPSAPARLRSAVDAITRHGFAGCNSSIDAKSLGK